MEQVPEDFRKKMAYAIAEGFAEIMPSPCDEVKSISEFPQPFLEGIFKVLQDFQSKFHELCAKGFRGISHDTEYGSTFGVMIPLIGGRYLSFVVQAPSVEADTGLVNGQVVYVFMIEVTAIDEDEDSDKLNGDIIHGVFMCQLMGDLEKGMDLNPLLVKMVEAMCKLRLEEK